MRQYTKTIIVLSVLCISSIGPVVSTIPIQTKASNEINILAIIPDRYGANTYFNLDNIELFGWQVTFTGLTEIVQPCPWAQSALGLPPIEVDVLISDIDDISMFDVLCIMPATWRSGEAYGDLIESEDTLDLIADANDQGLVIWATCAGTRVLAAADILNGIEVTGRIQFKSEYESAGAIYLGESIPPVISHNIITSMRGQYWNKENIEAIATVLEQQQDTITVTTIDDKEIFFQRTNQADGLWTKTYGGIYADGGKALCETPNSGALIIGYTYSWGTGASDIIAICIDETGEELWSNTYGGSGYEYGYGVCQSHDSGFIITGYSSSFDPLHSKDVYVAALDTDGTLLWEKTYGGTKLDSGRSICQTDNGYLICGYTESFGAGENDIYLLNIDKQGTILWENTYGGSGAELGFDIIQTSDGNFVLVGASGSDRANYDIYLVKIDAMGTVLWEQYHGAPGGDGGYDRGHAVVETTDGGFLIIGETNYGDALNMLVVKTDEQGDDEWMQIYGDRLHDHGSSIIQSSDGDYVLCGRIDTTNEGSKEMRIMKITDAGVEVWSHTIATSGADWATAVIETPDQGLLFTGHTSSFGAGSYDVLVMKTDEFGVMNQQPETPDAPVGPTDGSINEEYTFTAVTVDPDAEDIFYRFDWGDGTMSDWIGPFASGGICETIHSWEEQGSFEITVKARDVNGGESDWSDPLHVSMAKAKLTWIPTWLKEDLYVYLHPLFFLLS